LAIYKLILDKLFHFLVVTKIELNICEIMQNGHTQVLVFLGREQCSMKIQFHTGKIWARRMNLSHSQFASWVRLPWQVILFQSRVLMAFRYTECCGGTYFALQNMNLLLGCINEDPMNLTFSLPTSCTVEKEIIVYEVWGSHTSVVWNVMPCSLSSRGTCCHHLQYRKIFTLNMEVTVSSAIMVT
jgi:hypothetical protein